MNWHKLSIISGKELLSFSRDRRTLCALLVFPVLVTPGFVYMFRLALHNPKVAPMLVSGLFECLPIFFLSLVGHIAFEITAGEKERGTMETTLTLFATRTELVLGKYCAVVTANLIVAAIVLFFLLISLLSAALVSSTPVTWSGFSLIGFKAGLSYLTSVTYFAIVYPAILMLIGLFARSMKEAFSYLGPIMLLSILSTIAPLYGIGLSPLTLLVPGLNCLLLVQQYFNSSVDWMDWMILFCTGIVYAFACLKGAIFLIKRDAVLNRT